MAQYEEFQIEFAILSLVRDPLLDLFPKLAENIKSIAVLSARLDIIKPTWRQCHIDLSNATPADVLIGPSLKRGISQEDLNSAKLPEHIIRLSESEEIEDILVHYQQLVTAQTSLRMSIKDEEQSNQLDEDRATARRSDYGTRLQDFVRRVKTRKQA